MRAYLAAALIGSRSSWTWIWVLCDVTNENEILALMLVEEHGGSGRCTRATSWPRRTGAPPCSSLSLLALLWVITSTKWGCAPITCSSSWAPPYARPLARSVTRRRCSCSFRRANDYHVREIKQFLNDRIFRCELYFIKSTAMTNNNNNCLTLL